MTTQTTKDFDDLREKVESELAKKIKPTPITIMRRFELNADNESSVLKLASIGVAMGAPVVVLIGEASHDR